MEWVVRGATAFAMENGIWIVVAILLLLARRHVLLVPTLAIILAGWATLAAFLIWQAGPSRGFHDEPSRIGELWGWRLEPLFAAAFWVWLIVCLRAPKPPSGERAFPVMPSARDGVTTREQNH